MELQVQETLAGVERRVVERLDRLESKVDLLASGPRGTLAAPGAGGPTCSTGAGAAGGAPAAGLARRSGPREPAGKGPPRKSQASLVERRLAGVLCEDLERTAGAGAAARPQPPREAAAGCGPLAWAGGALAPAAEPEGLGRVRVQSLSDSSGEQVESLSSEVWTCPTVVVQQDAPSGVLTLEGGGLSMASLSAPSCQNERKPSRQAAELLKDLKAQEEQVETKVGKRAFTSQHRRKIMKRADAFRHTTDTARQGRLAGILAKAVSSTQFDLAITGIVFLNSLLIGAQVQHNAVSDKTVDAFVIMEFSCTAVFTVELCLRLAVHRSRFFTNPQECWWNVFDFVLVGLSLLDAFISLTFDGGLEGPGAFMGKLGRAIRMFRIVRIIRTVRFLSQLRVMLHMIVSSLQSLFWILVIMLGLIYMFAVVLTQGAADYLKDPSIQQLYAHTDEYRQVLDMYGSLFDTVYTLFMCMSGGITGERTSQPMRGPGWVLEAIVIGFVFFMVFAGVAAGQHCERGLRGRRH
ncbi:unnamed protein product [Prorocentrum cordatum]|uniref:Ion transport domain-containing protein n=1 Tax=Prorocentrum cordatum TaxID=2364126 RepID=A0ABN9T7K9_9DINO|nr:unnamed protein product [Polarella glacialis]